VLRLTQWKRRSPGYTFKLRCWRDLLSFISSDEYIEWANTFEPFGYSANVEFGDHFAFINLDSERQVHTINGQFRFLSYDHEWRAGMLDDYEVVNAHVDWVKTNSLPLRRGQAHSIVASDARYGSTTINHDRYHLRVYWR
jgi:hypothetical protein